MSAVATFDAAGLAAAGFEGFVPLATLNAAAVPAAPGVYVVLRADASAAPTFLDANPSGRFKGKDPTATVETLAANWIPVARVVYIGKAGRQTLRQRLSQYARHGAGEPVGHWGGRFIWQLAESPKLLVCWRSETTRDAEEVEAELLTQFAATYGRLPFANLKRGRAARG